MRPVAVVAGGILYALALPPLDWAACGWLTLVPLLWVVRRESTASAFRYGVLYGYAFGWAATWCFADAARRYFEMPFPMAVAALAVWYLVVCGVPFGLFAAGSSTILRSGGRRQVQLFIPALWVATEYLRGRMMGQPWALLGYTQHAQVGLIQVATLTGVYGVSFLVALGNTTLAELLDSLTSATHGPREPARALSVPAVVVAACWLGGWTSTPTGDVAGVGANRVAVVQMNLPPALHWTRSYTDAQVAAHVRATESLLPGRASLIVWPENSVPRYLESEPMLAVELATLARRQKADLLFGGPRYEGGHTYNSARLITAAGRNGGYYDKRRLVLFAEEKPLALSEHTGVNESPEEFSAGTGSGVLQSFVPIGVSICHEIVHPDLIRESVRGGAELLVNIANDGWLDGEYQVARRQHLAMAVFRAVETRRFVVRAATAGTSAVIDPYGRLVTSQAPDTAGIMTAAVVGQRTVTPYVRLGDLFAFVCLAIVVARFLRRGFRLPLQEVRTVAAPVPS
jgi:apolipoprotein N-acyltransferase